MWSWVWIIIYGRRYIMIPKVNMQNFTFCIPVRIDSKYRLRNLLAILEFYSYYLHANYIILEADNQQRVKELPHIPGLVYEFVYDENPVFHRTHYINRMLSKVSTDIVGIWDTDAVAPITQLWHAYQMISDKQTVMIYPYDGRFWYINDFFSSLFCEKLDLNIITNFEMPRHLMCGYYSVGGAFLTNVELYRQYGWENERFIGWGPEDCERYKRLHILGKTPARVTGSLYHLYHSRGVNSGDIEPKVIYETKKEYSKICRMMPEELRKYIESWNWIK